MTNKNKRSSVNTQKKENKKAARHAAPKEAAANPSGEREALQPFTTAQLGVLLCVSLGIAKIMELATASVEGTENPKTCNSYLIDEATCRHSDFASLILVKYYTSISLTVLVVSLMVLLWPTERMFMKFTTCLCVTPLTSTAFNAAIFEDGVMTRGGIFHLIMIAFVLMATCKPFNKDHFPFINNNEHNWTARSFQSLCLSTLTIISLSDIARVVINGAADGGMQNALVTSETPFSDPAASIVHFWIIDKLSMALLYAFAVVHLPTHRQRVS